MLARAVLASRQLELTIESAVHVAVCHELNIAIIKTHGSESRGQGGSTLRRPLDERT